MTTSFNRGGATTIIEDMVHLGSARGSRSPSPSRGGGRTSAAQGGPHGGISADHVSSSSAGGSTFMDPGVSEDQLREALGHHDGALFVAGRESPVKELRGPYKGGQVPSVGWGGQEAAGRADSPGGVVDAARGDRGPEPIVVNTGGASTSSGGPFLFVEAKNSERKTSSRQREQLRPADSLQVRPIKTAPLHHAGAGPGPNGPSEENFLNLRAETSLMSSLSQLSDDFPFTDGAVLDHDDHPHGGKNPLYAYAGGAGQWDSSTHDLVQEQRGSLASRSIEQSADSFDAASIRSLIADNFSANLPPLSSPQRTQTLGVPRRTSVSGGGSRQSTKSEPLRRLRRGEESAGVFAKAAEERSWR